MPQPSVNQVHINRPLTNISIAYVQSAKDFVADKVFPMVPVKQQSDLYFTYPNDYWFRTEAEVRAEASESAGSGYTVDATQSYNCKPLAVHKDVGDQVRANADAPLDMDRDATLFVTQQLLLKREKDFMNQYMKAGIWTGHTAGDFTPGNLWDATNGDPLKDIDSLKQEMKGKTSFLPNTLVVSADVFFVLRNNPLILERIKYTQKGIISEDLLASLFGVEKFLVASAVQNTAAEGKTKSNSFLLTNKALLCYSNPAPSLMMPSAGYIFTWNGLYGGSAYGAKISTMRMDLKKADRVEGEMAYDMKQVASDLGVLLTGVHS